MICTRRLIIMIKIKTLAIILKVFDVTDLLTLYSYMYIDCRTAVTNTFNCFIDISKISMVHSTISL